MFFTCQLLNRCVSLRCLFDRWKSKVVRRKATWRLTPTSFACWGRATYSAKSVWCAACRVTSRCARAHRLTSSCWARRAWTRRCSTSPCRTRWFAHAHERASATCWTSWSGAPWAQSRRRRTRRRTRRPPPPRPKPTKKPGWVFSCSTHVILCGCALSTYRRMFLSTVWSNYQINPADICVVLDEGCKYML